MLTEARLLTPDGQTIILSVTEYQKVLETLAIQMPSLARPSLAKTRALVDELRGKYAVGPSLTQALLEERRRERQREEAKVRRYARRA
ncbi:MAG TPA: hypothetical protein VJ793_14545 [Anaerolineae bacterium]|nr:hypothetical protein [Anaerolineae bacterium]